MFPGAISDGSGGAIVAWQVNQYPASFDIFYRVQRVDASGALLWGPGGVLVPGSHGAEGYVFPTMASDGRGGAILAWRGGDELLAQRIDGTGTPRWGANAVSLGPNNWFRLNPAVTSDGEGGAMIAWEQFEFDYLFSDIAGQRLDSEGQTRWGDSGILICGAQGGQSWVRVSRDGEGGFLAFWGDERGPFNHAQRLTADGVAMWTPDGVPTGGASAGYSKEILPDGTGGAFLQWSVQVENRVGSYVQRLGPGGAILWDPAGVPFSTATTQVRFGLGMILDGQGGVIVPWYEDGDLFAQRFDGSGSKLWGPTGAPISTAPGNQDYPRITTDGDGGAILVWADPRDPEGNTDIYAQHVNRQGKLGPPARPVSSGGPSATGIGAAPRMALEAPHPSPTHDEARIRFRLTRDAHVAVILRDVAGHQIRVLLDGRLNAGAHELRFEARDTRGLRLGAGLYFISVASDGETLTRKIVVY